MYKVVEDSVETIISLDCFKEFARVTSCVSSDEVLMEVLISASIEFCEKYTGLSIATKTYERIYKSGCELKSMDTLDLRKGFVSEVLEISENEKDGTATLLDLTDISIENYKQESLIYTPNATFSLGSHPLRPFVVKFVAGWTEETIPANLKVAILQLATYWYENRESVQIMDENNIAEMPFGTATILKTYKLMRL